MNSGMARSNEAKHLLRVITAAIWWKELVEHISRMIISVARRREALTYLRQMAGVETG
jgi:hypothetical protein